MNYSQLMAPFVEKKAKNTKDRHAGVAPGPEKRLQTAKNWITEQRPE